MHQDTEAVEMDDSDNLNEQEISDLLEQEPPQPKAVVVERRAK